MNTHKNARLTPYSREELVRRALREGMTVKDPADAFGVSRTTVRKWITRFRAEGADGFENRYSRPHRLYSSISERILGRIVALRFQRWTGKRIAAERGISASTVSHHLRFLKLSRMKDLEPRPAIIRYERKTSGEIIHMDIKALRCFAKSGYRTGRHTETVHTPRAGWEYLHVAIDDHSRISFVSMMPDQTSRSAIAFLQAAIGYYQSLGVTVKGIMTDKWALLYLQALPQGLCRAGHPAQAHSTLHSQNQRQGRALHTDRTPGVGLCSCLSDIPGTSQPVASLDPPLQLAPTSQQSQGQGTHQ